MEKSLMYNRKGSYGTEQSYVGHISLIWDRPVSYGTGQSPMGQSSSKGFSEAQKKIKRPQKSSNKSQKEYKGLKNESKWV